MDHSLLDRFSEVLWKYRKPQWQTIYVIWGNISTLSADVQHQLPYFPWRISNSISSIRHNISRPFCTPSLRLDAAADWGLQTSEELRHILHETRRVRSGEREGLAINLSRLIHLPRKVSRNRHGFLCGNTAICSLFTNSRDRPCDSVAVA